VHQVADQTEVRKNIVFILACHQKKVTEIYYRY